MWWFAAVHRNLLLVYRRIAGAEAAERPLLDAGCGTGGLLAHLAASCHGRTVIGLDADALAATRAARKSGQPVCTGSVNALPFADNTFATIFSVDVLCHRDVDVAAALTQFHRCLPEGGVLILNLPAYRWLLSRHDVAVANVRRYTRHSIARLLHAAGFRLVFVTYWNSLLLPIMVITRKLLPSGREATSDVRRYSAPAEILGRIATGIETALLSAGVRFPCGGSLLAVAVKPAQQGG